MKAEYDEFGNGVAIWEEALTDKSKLYSVRMYGRALDRSFIEFACEDCDHATSLAQELEKTIGTEMTIEVRGLQS